MKAAVRNRHAVFSDVVLKLLRLSNFHKLQVHKKKYEILHANNNFFTDSKDMVHG